MTTTVQVVHHKSAEEIDQSSSSHNPDPSLASSSQHSERQKHRRHSRSRPLRSDSAQSRKSVPESSVHQTRDTSGTDPVAKQEPFYPQSFLRQRSISFDSHPPLFDTNSSVVTTCGGTIVTTSALTVSDYTLNTSTRIPLKFGRYTHHHPHFYHHQVFRRPSVPIDVPLATTGHDPSLTAQSKEPITDELSGGREGEGKTDMELMELPRSGNSANYVVGSINNNMSRGNVTKISIGEHRELPVDVPDSFVGVIKQAPRYPPPPPVHTPVGTLTSRGSVPSRKGSSSTTGSSANRSDASKVHTKAVSSSSPPIEREKMKKYSDDVSRKRSEEQFLRSSLRGSKKLQQLQQQKIPPPDAVDFSSPAPEFSSAAVDFSSGAPQFSSAAPDFSSAGINPAFESDDTEHDYQNLGRLQEQNKGLHSLHLFN